MTTKELTDVAMTDEEHRQLHVTLHDQLDILVRDMMSCTGMSVSGMTVAELLDWSSEQTREVEQGRRNDESRKNKRCT